MNQDLENFDKDSKAYVEEVKHFVKERKHLLKQITIDIVHSERQISLCEERIRNLKEFRRHEKSVLDDALATYHEFIDKHPEYAEPIDA
jgi:uncharacterized protein YigA (DUF484 family)